MTTRFTIPAMLDPHTHLRGLDWTHKGDFASETAAAVAGGYWAVFDMPNTPPATINPDALAHKLAAFGAQARCDWGAYFGASASGNWHHYDDVYQRVCGLKIYNNQTTGDLLVENQYVRSLIYSTWNPSRVIAVHAEEDTVLEILALVRQTRRFTHFCHISSAREIVLLAAAKNAGLPISVGVCPHHLWLTQQDLPALGARGLMKPELKTQADVDALWWGIARGVVDVVESDHAPHTLDEKASDTPPYGVPGLETTLPLLLTAVHDGRLTLERVVELVAENPRRIWGLNAPPQTYTVVDLDASTSITGADLHTHVKWSPFEGMRVYGKVLETVIRGQRVYDGEHVLAQPGFGQNLFAG